MKSSFLYTFALFIVFCLFSSCGEEKNDNERDQNKGRQLELEGKVTFLNNNGEEISTIEVAISDEQSERNQGLMDVITMPPEVGMLFIFPDEEELSFYMANTPLPLDIIFVNSDSTIVRIHHNTTPFSNKQLPSGQPAQFVVETNGGYCVSNDIQEGYKISF